MTKFTSVSKEEKKLLIQTFFHSLPIMGSFNLLVMQGIGYCVAMMPAIDHFYAGQPMKKKAALVRHIAFFNTTQAMSTFPIGLSVSMEKENAEVEGFDTQSINAIKVSLMGPLAGVGDAFFWGTLRVIGTGAAIGLASSGNVLGPLVYLLVYNIPAVLLKYYGLFAGYSLGSRYIKQVYESGLLNIITKAASVLGLIMVGGMTAQMVSYHVTFKSSLGGTEFILQEVLDQVFKGLIPFCITLVCFLLIRKKKNPNLILVGLILFGIISKILGII